MGKLRESLKSRFRGEQQAEAKLSAVSSSPNITAPSSLVLRPTTASDPPAGDVCDWQRQPSSSQPTVDNTSTKEPTSSLWDGAYDALCEEQPELLARYQDCFEQYLQDITAASDCDPRLTKAALDFRSTDPTTRRLALSAISDAGLERAKRSGTYTLFGKTFNAREQVADVSSFLSWIQNLVGEGVKASPEASIVFAGVSIIIPLLASPQTAENANQDGFIYVTSRMKYYLALETAARECLSTSKQSMASLLMEIEETAKELFKNIIEFQVRSVVRFFKNWIKTAGGDVLRPKDWQDRRDRINTLEERLHTDLQTSLRLSSVSTLNSCLKKALAAGEELSRLCSLSSAQLQTAQNIQHTVDSMHQKQLSDDQRKCLQGFALNLTGDEKSYEWYKGRVDMRAEGTCQWFLAHGSYGSWKSATSGPLLVTADPGCGKSVLAKSLIDQDLPRGATVAYFFFKDQSQNAVSQALCALLHQLFSSPQGAHLLQHALKPWERHGESLTTNTPQLYEIFRNVISDEAVGRVIIVLDALDECEPQELPAFLKLLGKLLLAKYGGTNKVKCLMTSRPYDQVMVEFRELLEGFPHLHIPGENESGKIKSEVNIVIRLRTKRLAQELRWPPAMRDYLCESLLRVENRTYLWVHLVFDFLRQRASKTRKSVEILSQILSKLPKSVNDAYEKILSRVEPEDFTFVRKALSIVLAAIRPLTIMELNEALQITDAQCVYEDLRLQLESGDEFCERLRACCGLLISIHHGRVHLIHQTVREFLLKSEDAAEGDYVWRGSILLEDAHLAMTWACVTYMSLVSRNELLRLLAEPEPSRFQRYILPRQSRYILEFLVRHCFMSYAAERWGQHLRAAESATSFSELLGHLQFVDGYSEPYAHLLQCYGVFRSRPSPKGDKRLQLHATAWMDHAKIAQVLIQQGADLEETDGLSRRPLHVAAQQGSDRVAAVLIEAGADLEARGGKCGPPLLEAISANMARLLLGYGADISARGPTGSAVFLEAVTWDDVSMLELLRQRGADVNVKDANGSTALHKSVMASPRSLSKIEYLLDLGLSPETRNRFGETPLASLNTYEWSARGVDQVFRLLIRYGADVNARNRHGKTMLHEHVQNAFVPLLSRDWLVCLKDLLLGGADPKAQDAKGRTPSEILRRQLETRERPNEERSLMEEERSLMEQERSLMEQERSLIEQERSLMEEKRSLMEEERSLVEEIRGLIKKTRRLMEEIRGLIKKRRSRVEKERGLIKERRSLVEKERSLMEEALALLEEFESRAEAVGK